MNSNSFGFNAYHAELLTLSQDVRHRVSVLDSSVFLIESDQPGPRVSILGAVHGDEPCGWHAIVNLMKGFGTGEHEICKGSVVLALGNEQALHANVRYLEMNLNRLFKDGVEESNCYEFQRAQILKPILKEADYLLDLHATSRPSQPFLMCEGPSLSFVRQVSNYPIIVGWNALGDPSLAGDTENLVARHGGVACTAENGVRDWPGGGACAYDLALRFLELAGVLAGKGVNCRPEGMSKVYTLYLSQVLEDPSFSYSLPSPETFQFLPKGTVIGCDNCRSFVATEDSYLIMPSDPSQKKVGEDLYLLARPELNL